MPAERSKSEAAKDGGLTVQPKAPKRITIQTVSRSTSIGEDKIPISGKNVIDDLYEQPGSKNFV